MNDTIQPLPTTNRFSQVLERLRELVESGRVQPGERLPSERELALALGVNRSSVREALRALQSAGLVDIQHGRGVFVQQAPPMHEALLFRLLTGDLTPEIVPDLVETRMLIEGGLARVAAEWATPEHVARLDELVADLETGITSDPLSLAADTPFHLAIAGISGNRLLEAIVSVTYELAAKFFDDYVAAPDEAVTILREHRLIADKIRDGDSAGAEALMRDHVDHGRVPFENYVRARSAGTAGTRELEQA